MTGLRPAAGQPWLALVHQLAIRAQRHVGRNVTAARPLWIKPYPLDLYATILSHLRRHERVVFVDAACMDRRLLPGQVGIYLRHDLDIGLGSLSEMTRCEMELGIRSSIQVRVDGVDYDPGAFVGELRELKAAGFEIGLHTQAYVERKPQAALGLELGIFERLFGTPPDSVSTHGVLVRSVRMLLRRERFRWLLGRSRLRSAELLGGMHPKVVCGDSARLPQAGERFLGREILDAPDMPAGAWSLWLTHPAYWTPDSAAGSRERVDAVLREARAR